MRRAAAIIMILFLLFGNLSAAAKEKIIPREAVIVNTDGTEETLTDQELIFRRLNVRESTKSLTEKSGQEKFLNLEVVFPKDAEKVYLTLQAPGAVPGDELLVLQNGKRIRGEVTGTDEITFYFTESGQIEIYRSAEAEEEEVPESAVQETEETEAAPATGESPASAVAERWMGTFAVLAVISAVKCRRTTKRKYGHR